MGNRLQVIAISLVVAAVILFGGSAVQSVDLHPSAYISSGEVTATAGPVYLDRTGHPTVVGEVYNDRGGPIDNVTVTVDFYEDDEPVGTVTERPIVTILGNKQAAPFSIRLDDSSASPDTVTASVAFDERDEPPYRQLGVEDTRADRQSQDQVTVRGSVENDGARTVEGVLVAVTFYDGSGTVIGVRSERPSPASLDPGESGQFHIQFNTLGQVPSTAREYDRFEVEVYAV